MTVNYQKYANLLNPENKQSFDDGHLGGCNIKGDPALELIKTWKYLIDTLNIKSVIDVGCGFGFHTKSFKEIFNLEVLGIEGSSKVVELCLRPDLIVCHDYTTGPFIPDKIYDMCWSVEFVEHVDERFISNFIETFKKSKVLVMTHGIPGQGGHHHVNEQPADYWIDLLSKNGFELQKQLTDTCRKISAQDKEDYYAWRVDTSADRKYRGPAAEAHGNTDIMFDHFFERNGLVFFNKMIK